jgi:hypothetical protein
MTSNRFVKGEPSASVSERVIVKNSKVCEIPGCKTRYVPSPHGKGKGIHLCGYADVLVKDHRGDLRGICATHYTRELVRQGKAANQELVDADGRVVLAKVQSVRESEQIPLAIQPPMHGAPKGPQQFTVPDVVAREIDRGDHVGDDEFFANHERNKGFA